MREWPPYPVPLAQKRAPSAERALFRYFLIQLCAGRNVRINHQQMELFFAVFVMHGGDQHAAGVDAHHLARGQVDDGDSGLADELLGLVILVDAGEDDAILARAVVEHKLQQLLGLLHRLARLDLDGAEVRLGEGVKVDLVSEQRLDLDLGEVDDLLLLHFGGSGFRLVGLLGHVQRLHRGDGKDISVIGLLKWYSLYYPK